VRVIEHVRSLDPPWAFLAVLKPGQDAQAVLAGPAGFVARVADGRRCRTKPELLAELPRVLGCPADAAPNWDALEECLADLEWLPAAGYIIGVSHAEELLSESPDDYDVFLSIIEEVGKEWSSPRGGEWPRPAAPFHVGLTVLEGRQSAHRDWRVPTLEP
jgi:hypothetical protein